MKGLYYNGYVIAAAPYQLTEDKKWAVNIIIWKDRGGSITQKQFSASNTFIDKEEAIQQCYNFGKQIIDGVLKYLTGGDLQALL